MNQKKMVNKEKIAMGKKSRAAGSRFELKVRADLEKNWIVDKWSNNVELVIEYQGISNQTIPDEVVVGKLVKVKNKWAGQGRPMMLGAGFPDFIALKHDGYIGKEPHEDMIGFHYSVIGVESKMDGKLDKVEKEKCEWLIQNNIFSKILIASKGTKRGQIVYNEFKSKK